MKVYFDTEFDALVISTAPEVYRARSLQAEREGDRIEIWLKGPNVRKAGPLSYTAIMDKNGNTFSDAGAAKSYLDDEFRKYRNSFNVVVIDLTIVQNIEINVLSFRPRFPFL